MRQKYLPILLCSVILLLMPTSTLAQAKAKLKAYSVVRPARDAHGNVLDPATASAISSLRRSPIRSLPAGMATPIPARWSGRTRLVPALARQL